MAIKLASPESVGFCAQRLTRINEFMHEKTAHDRYAGISTLVARHGKVIFSEQIGLRDKEANLPLQEDTLFRLYSMTKPIVCTAFMHLYEQGKVDLNDPVAKYIPGFAHLKVAEVQADGSEKLVTLQQPVLIFHLLTHTAGLSYDFYDSYSICEQYRQVGLCAKTEGVSLNDFVNKLCDMPLAFQPGTKWHYSVSIDVVARLIEIIADQALDIFLQDIIFKPLEMESIGFYQPEERRARVAAVYGGVDICAPNIGWKEMMAAWESGESHRLDVSNTCPVDDKTFYRGGLGLSSTIEDYYRFTQMLLNKGELNGTRILSPKTLELMHMNHVKQDMLPICYEGITISGYGFGLGSRVLLDVAATELAGSVGEYGWAGAANTYYWVDPKEDLTAIFMTQSMCDFSFTVREFQALVYQAMVK